MKKLLTILILFAIYNSSFAQEFGGKKFTVVYNSLDHMPGFKAYKEDSIIHHMPGHEELLSHYVFNKGRCINEIRMLPYSELTGLLMYFRSRDWEMDDISESGRLRFDNGFKHFVILTFMPDYFVTFSMWKED